MQYFQQQPQQFMPQPGMMPQQQFAPQQQFNMYQPQPQQQQFYQQPMQQQPVQQPLTTQAAEEALAKYIANMANATQLSGYLYQRYSQTQWQDPEFKAVAMIAYALAAANLQRAPALGAQQALAQAVPAAYEINNIIMLESNPQLIQSMPQQIMTALLQNMPSLQQQLNTAMPMIGKPSIPLNVPGYTVQQQAPNMVPMNPGFMQMQQPIQSQYGLSTQGMSQPMQQPGVPTSRQANLGYSDARPVIPPTPTQNNLGLAPVKVDNQGQSLIGATLLKDDQDVGISARQVSFAAPQQSQATFEPLIKTLPQQQHAQPIQAEQPQQQPQAPAHWNAGVMESMSTPSLANAIQQQLNMPQQYPSDINFDTIMELSSDEENQLFNPPAEEDTRPMPSMNELFNPTFGANKAAAVDPFAFMSVNSEATYTHHEQNENTVVAPINAVPVESLPEVRPVSEDGLPDGWLFTESHYDAPSEEFYATMMKAPRHRVCPWPIGYDRRFCTRLYRYMSDGSIEQKIVGVPMDRLKHDLSLLDTPVPTQEIYDAEKADFGPLMTMGVKEAIKIIKDPDTTEKVLEEKLGDKSIYLVDKPIVALCRQEAMLLTAAKVKPLQDKLEKGTHGFETQIRECRIITQRPEVDAFMASPLMKALSQESDVPNIIELAETIRSIRNEGVMSDFALRKVTEFMRETINMMLYADYGYAGTIELEDAGNLFEDELTEFVLYMNQTESNTEVLDRIVANWANVRSRLCTLLIGDALHNAQQQLARRYSNTDEERDAMVAQMEGAVLLEISYSITTMARTTKQLRLVDNRPAFVTMQSDRPYLHQLMTDIKKRGKATGRTLNKHLIITSDGVEIGFAQAGLGNGDTFPTYYSK